MRLAAGQIVLVDWRDGLPKEPKKNGPLLWLKTVICSTTLIPILS